jgi:hypothetical protein
MDMHRVRRLVRIPSDDAVCFLHSSHACLRTGATPLLSRTIYKQSASSSMPMHPVLLFCMRTAWQRERTASRHSWRKEPSCDGAKRAVGDASMHVGIVPAVWLHVRDARFLHVASTYTRCDGVPWFFLVCDCVCDSLSVSFLFSLTHSLSLTHFLPFSFVFFSRGVRSSLFPHIFSMHMFFFNSILSLLVTSGFALARLIPFYLLIIFCTEIMIVAVMISSFTCSCYAFMHVSLLVCMPELSKIWSP